MSLHPESPIERKPAPLDQSTVNEILLNPAFQAVMQQAVAEGVEKALAIKEHEAKPDFVLVSDYDSLTKEEYAELLANPADDEAYYNREQRGHEESSDTPGFDARNLESFIPKNDKIETATSKYRPYSAILKDINNEKATNPVDESAEFETKYDRLTDELAARITLEQTDYSVNGASDDNTRQELLIDLQKRGLSDEDALLLIDKIDAFDTQIITAENEVDEILINEIQPALEAIIVSGKKPMDFFRDVDKKQTPEYLEMDRKFTDILRNIKNPIVRASVLQSTNAQLRESLRIAEVKFAKLEASAGKPVDSPKPTGKKTDVLKLTQKELEKKINTDAAQLAVALDRRAKSEDSSGNIIGHKRAYADYLNYVDAKKAKDYYASKPEVSLSDSPEGKAIVRGVGRYLRNLHTTGTKDEIEAKIVAEMQLLSDVFDKQELANPIVKKLHAPKGFPAPKGRIIKRLGARMSSIRPSNRKK